ncbi:hypothetical protein K1719_001741 [Acacia pycnantha]|nr:hypothetical protein K1719_001741 [Acacia pycnantha]
MVAQEMIELFCELIDVCLPIIKSQKECPLDLKETISSVCFAAPRYADLPELLLVQMSLASKCGKEFASIATELRPNCEFPEVPKISVRSSANFATAPEAFTSSISTYSAPETGLHSSIAIAPSLLRSHLANQIGG